MSQLTCEQRNHDTRWWWIAWTGANIHVQYKSRWNESYLDICNFLSDAKIQSRNHKSVLGCIRKCVCGVVEFKQSVELRATGFRTLAGMTSSGSLPVKKCRGSWQRLQREQHILVYLWKIWGSESLQALYKHKLNLSLVFFYWCKFYISRFKVVLSACARAYKLFIVSVCDLLFPQ